MITVGSKVKVKPDKKALYELGLEAFCEDKKFFKSTQFEVTGESFRSRWFRIEIKGNDYFLPKEMLVEL